MNYPNPNPDQYFDQSRRDSFLMIPGAASLLAQAVGGAVNLEQVTPTPVPNPDSNQEDNETLQEEFNRVSIENLTDFLTSIFSNDLFTLDAKIKMVVIYETLVDGKVKTYQIQYINNDKPFESDDPNVELNLPAKIDLTDVTSEQLADPNYIADFTTITPQEIISSLKVDEIKLQFAEVSIGQKVDKDFFVSASETVEATGSQLFNLREEAEYQVATQFQAGKNDLDEPVVIWTFYGSQTTSEYYRILQVVNTQNMIRGNNVTAQISVSGNNFIILGPETATELSAVLKKAWETRTKKIPGEEF